ncbi:MAG TPA: Asp-tRNA(Asn)/Glu-tRNA(Gln) amidotransferase subunit GatA [Trueperaceae bacterium]|nr:Asp-tRNA(Asn)/Glu-tRNA(Gln) amidotransferase subunit GatA [Trueperaceae bacterium]
MTSAWRTARDVRGGALRAVEVVRAALGRAEAARELNALVTVTAERALACAERIDAAVSRGEDPGPLAGVPVVLKDNLCLEGVPATAGSKALEGFVPPYTATVVARLEAAGAVVIAKSNLDEFGMGSTNETSSFGPVLNPWDRARVPGGSSGGSAAAVAAGVVPLALGTDTGGSVRLPASFCGVLGIKPTYGRLSRYGVIAYASSLEQVGVLSRSSRDAALALGVMAGADPRDGTSLDADAEALRALGTDGGAGTGDLSGLRVAVVRELSEDGNDRGVLDALERTRAALRELGAEVREVGVPSVRFAVAAYYLVATAEASSNLARYDGMLYSTRVGEDADGQEAVMRRSRGAGLGREVRRRVLMGSFALSAGYYDAYYGKALKVRRVIADDLARAFEGADLLLTPTAPSPAYRLGEKLDDPLAMYVGDVCTCLANLSGLPAVSVPAGFTAEGLPAGVQLLAPALQEARLLRAAAALEARAGDAFAPTAPGFQSG